MFKKLFILVLLFSLDLAAIGRVGNGGNIIVCLKPESGHCYGRQGYAGAFYDTYEADIRYQMKPLSMADNFVEPASAVDYAVQLLDSVKKHDLELAAELTGFVEDFEAEANFVSGIVLLPVPDTGISFIPYSSELKQLVIQTEPITVKDKRYLISTDLWLLMTKADQAHAILHEVLYRFVLHATPNIKTSDSVRYFNAYIISGEFNRMSKKEYNEVKYFVLQNEMKKREITFVTSP